MVASLITALEADDGALLEIQQSGRSDGEYKALERAIQEGWPSKHEIPALAPELAGFFKHRESLMVGP